MGVLWLILGIIVISTKTEGIGARSNILVFLTDDQDVFLDGMEPLQKTKKLLVEKGKTFSNAFATTPVCCPSRASLLTGKYPHNTGTINNTVAGNCGGQYWRTNGEMNTFASILQKSGYETMYAGKYMNQYGTPEAGGIHQVPVGWSQWNGLQGNSRYYNYKLSINGVEENHEEDYESDYLTDVVGRKAEGFLNSWSKTSPFLMVLATPASHAPFTPAPQYKDNFPNLTAPRIPSYNQQPGSTKHWFLRTEPQILTESVRDSIDLVYRNRWRTLLSVDDLVSATIQHLQDIGELENTYIIYTSDHGYHMGEFGLTIDKRQPYEFDIRVPLFIRGPNIPMNTTSNTPALLIDLAPTILDMAGIKPSDDMDGVSLIDRSDEGGRMFLVEYSGEGGLGVHPNCSQWNTGDFSFCIPEFGCKCQDARNNTYTCLRRIEVNLDSMFCRFQDDEIFEEYYDIKKDPFQLENLAPGLGDILEEERMKMEILSSCSGFSCQETFKHSPHPIIDLI